MKCDHDWGIWGEAHENSGDSIFLFLQQYSTCKKCGMMKRRTFARGFNRHSEKIANESRNVLS